MNITIHFVNNRTLIIPNLDKEQLGKLFDYLKYEKVFNIDFEDKHFYIMTDNVTYVEISE